jgi:hypothetical protein
MAGLDPGRGSVSNGAEAGMADAGVMNPRLGVVTVEPDLQIGVGR